MAALIFFSLLLSMAGAFICFAGLMHGSAVAAWCARGRGWVKSWARRCQLL